MSNLSQSPRNSCSEAYALCAASTLLFLLVGAPLQLYSLPLGLLGTELFLILLPAIWYAGRKGIGVARGLAWQPVTAGIALRSIVFGITACWIAGALDDLVSCFILGSQPSSDDTGPQSVPELTLMLFVAAILPGICEETLFRGVIFGILQRKSTVKAVTISAALFALYHLSPWALLPSFFAGLLFGMLRARTGSTVPGMIAHALSNATAFIASYLAPDDSLSAGVIIFASVLFALAGVEFLHHTSHLLPARSPLATVPAALSSRLCLLVGLVILLALSLLVGLLMYRHSILNQRSH